MVIKCEGEERMEVGGEGATEERWGQSWGEKKGRGAEGERRGTGEESLKETGRAGKRGERLEVRTFLPFVATPPSPASFALLPLQVSGGQPSPLSPGSSRPLPSLCPPPARSEAKTGLGFSVCGGTYTGSPGAPRFLPVLPPDARGAGCGPVLPTLRNIWSFVDFGLQFLLTVNLEASRSCLLSAPFHRGGKLRSTVV